MRFSLKTLAIAFSLLAICCAALLYPNVYLIAAIYTAAILVIAFALTAACITREMTRAYWIGFTIFAVAHFGAAFYGDLQPDNRNAYSFPLISSQMLISLDTWLSLQRPARTAHTILGTAIEVTMPIGHAVLTVISGLVGGVVGRWVYRWRDAG